MNNKTDEAKQMKKLYWNDDASCVIDAPTTPKFIEEHNYTIEAHIIVDGYYGHYSDFKWLEVY